MYFSGFNDLATKQLKQIQKKAPLAAHLYRFVAQSVLMAMANGTLSPLEVSMKFQLSLVRQVFATTEVRFAIGFRAMNGFAITQLKENLSRKLSPTYIFLI